MILTVHSRRALCIAVQRGAKSGGKLLAISPAKGAETIVYLASSPAIAGTTGQYFYKCRPIAPSQNDRTAHFLWERSAAFAGLKAPST